MPFINKTRLSLAVLVSLLTVNSQVAAFAATGSAQYSQHNVPRNSFTVKPGYSVSEAKPMQVLIRPKHGVSPEILAELNKGAGAKTVASINKLGAMRVNIAGGDINKALETYRSSGLVEYAEPNFKRKAAAVTPNDPLYLEQWGLAKIGMPEAWEKAGTNLTQIKVAVLDTGVNVAHEDLQGVFAQDPGDPSRILGKHFYSDTSGKQLSDDNLQDNAGHGTHIAGIIAAAANNNKGIAGVAPAVRIMPVKILDDVGFGDDANIAQGLIWATDNGARVINMSLAGPAQSQTLADAIKYAYERGVVIVAATGNEGVSDLSYPAAYEGVIGVGAADSNDNWVRQSNYGNYVDVVAPGVSILSTYPPAKSADGEAYEEHSGTSMAAGFVSGLAATVLSVNPALSNTRVEGIVFAAADDVHPAGWDRYTGYGRINAARAVDIINNGTTPTVSIESPQNGITVTGTSVTVLANVSDSGTNTAFVDFLLNGQRVGSDVAAPYQLNMAISQFEGRNNVRVVAYDRNGNVSSSEITLYKQTFVDVVPSFWAFEDIEVLTAQKVLSGYPDGNFRPTSSVGRAEFLKMLIEGLGLAKKSYYSGYFKDIPVTHWAWPYIESAYDMGLVTGYGDNLFSPETRIKRVEMATILIKTGAFAINYSGEPFADVSAKYWGYVYVMSARNAKAISGYPGNLFRPEQSMNRAEAARVIKSSFISD